MTPGPSKSRITWGSRLGIILATSGAAVGLGNIQRFPYMVAEHGGGIFVLCYLLAVLILGLPLMLCEFALGRNTKANPVKAYGMYAPRKWKKFWQAMGFLGVLTAYGVLCYYVVPSAWTIQFFVKGLTGDFGTLTDLKHMPLTTYGVVLLLLGSLLSVQFLGLRQGLERLSKIMMPMLFLLIIALVIYSLTLPGASKGIEFYLTPDWSKLTPRTMFFALSQAFFSLCIGEALLLTFGSYTAKKENLVSISLSIIFFDTMVALLSGLFIFPIFISLNAGPSADMGIIYQVMGELLPSLPFGHIAALLFFALLSLAAFSTCISLFEVANTYIKDNYNWPTSMRLIVLALPICILSFLCLLSSTGSSAQSELERYLAQVELLGGTGFYAVLDVIFGNLAMVIGGLACCIFTAYIWGVNRAKKELAEGMWAKNKLAGIPAFYLNFVWPFLICFIVPLIIVFILISLIL